MKAEKRGAKEMTRKKAQQWRNVYHNGGCHQLLQSAGQQAVSAAGPAVGNEMKAGGAGNVVAASMACETCGWPAYLSYWRNIGESCSKS
jgi:hypothetical protein